MAIFYFNGAVDSDWNTLGNWWLDDTFTTPAISLPSNTDDVVVSQPINTNSGGGVPTVANYTSNSYGVFNEPGGQNNYINIDIIVTGTATFNGSSNPQGMTLTGNCIFNDSAQNATNIIGNCTFNSISSNVGTIAGNCTFWGYSHNDNAINGDCTFNENSMNSGNVYKTSSTGNCTFNGSAQNNGQVNGVCTFNNTSNNSGVVFAVCTFNDHTVNYGPITGDCTFNDYAFCGVSSSVSDLATFNDYAICDSCSYLNDAVFNGASYCVWTTVNGNITFNDSAYLVDGGYSVCHQSVVFNDSSYYAYIAGNNDNITFNGSVSFTNRTPYPIPRGINGSSILGVF